MNTIGRENETPPKKMTNLPKNHNNVKELSELPPKTHVFQRQRKIVHAFYPSTNKIIQPLVARL